MKKVNSKLSMIIYYTYREQFELLTGDEVKKLILAMIDYDKDGIEPKFEGMLKMAFSFIKTNLDIDSEKYKKICERNIENGKKGGRPKKPTGLLENPKNPHKPKKADIDIDIDIDNDIDIDIDNENDIYDYIENNFGRTLSPIEYEEINNWEDNELTRYAIKQAVLNGKCNIKYISRILQNYKNNSIETVQQAQEDEIRFKNKNNTKENKPKWFDEKITKEEATEEEIQEMDELLKQFKR